MSAKELTMQEYYDELYVMELKRRLAAADDDIRNGRVMSIEQARETTLRELREEYAHRNNK